ncbi:hypothetical protein EVJ50_09085 [Synechococcus sp. RSCCF101]|uniref:hypothetical protein n=1 Tax=Synechococcus sp. RSCCF101 TaxID=2511069 RepID=UPI00124877E9|nr:hypothetical protein [Synechococcus sp. RSCCF101]QEY32353.1 hypothetical protein EVJ50_09085 [Synechococcus sp. RSCCF101]
MPSWLRNFISTPAPQAETTSQGSATNQLDTLSALKLFHDAEAGVDTVALFGQPSTADDGWVMNCPASEVLEGDPRLLPFELLLPATDVHARVPLRPQWLDKVPELRPEELPQDDTDQTVEENASTEDAADASAEAAAPAEEMSPREQLQNRTVHLHRRSIGLAMAEADAAAEAQDPLREFAALEQALSVTLRLVPLLSDSKASTQALAAAGNRYNRIQKLAVAQANAAREASDQATSFAWMARIAPISRQLSGLLLDPGLTARTRQAAVNQHVRATSSAMALANQARDAGQDPECLNWLVKAASLSLSLLDLLKEIGGSAEDLTKARTAALNQHRRLLQQSVKQANAAANESNEQAASALFAQAAAASKTLLSLMA